jgi:hypothetical protein
MPKMLDVPQFPRPGYNSNDKNHLESKRMEIN